MKGPLGIDIETFENKGIPGSYRGKKVVLMDELGRVEQQPTLSRDGGDAASVLILFWGIKKAPSLME